MATLTVPPSPVPFTMSSLRIPLSANPSIANSPIRSPSALSTADLKKRQQLQKRTYASVQRDEVYNQPPPAKRQMIDVRQDSRARSPVKVSRVPVPSAQVTARRRQQAEDADAHDAEALRNWQVQQRDRLPKSVFYFESVPAEQKTRFIKALAYYGAREDKFFSNNVTHVVTSRAAPDVNTSPEDGPGANAMAESHQEQQHRTINPSLLTHTPGSNPLPTRRRLFETAPSRPMLAPHRDITTPQLPVMRNTKTDLLVRAKEMGKKVWTVKKLSKILHHLQMPEDGNAPAADTKVSEQPNLAQLLDKERNAGPSKGDPAEMHYFKGPFIYIYDIEEKKRPIMIREYGKVSQATDGDWPQFRSSKNGRSPFAFDPGMAEEDEKAAAKEKARKTVRQENAAAASKRPLAELQDGQNRQESSQSTTTTRVFEAGKPGNPMPSKLQSLKLFKQHAMTPRTFGGEPAASGMQPSNVTSAIRSQMISSATGGLGVKAGTHKEVYGLQRQVLQRGSQASRDMSSRPNTGNSVEHASLIRSTSLGAGSPALEALKENDSQSAGLHKRTMSAPAKPKNKTLKPGYCENCQDKYNDFDEHIVSRKHRKFAEDDRNWVQLDALLCKLERAPKYANED